MNRVRWTSAVVAILLAVAVIPLLVRGRLGAGQEEAPKPGAPVPAEADGSKSEAVTTTLVRGKLGAGQEEGPKPGAPVRAEADGSKSEAVTTPAPRPDPASLQTIGALTAAHYFQSYLNIGFIADGKAKGTYTPEDARKVLRSVLSVVDSVDRQLAAFGKRNLDKEDRESLEQMRAISTLLRQQGQELQTYWADGRDEDAARYEALRQKSYAAISKLMGIDR
jgi:hypothetical protein